jgi:uncharacterized protein (TIGR02145 family)
MSIVVLLSSLLSAQSKIALVIGNSDYKQMPLKNPKNDAFDLAYTLMSLGFDVILKTNLNHREMEESIREFKGKIMPGDVALFYYSGHGIQVNGLNYLIPVNEAVENEIDIKYNCMETGFVLDVMERARSAVNIIILDACRNNPYQGYRSTSRGFAFMSAPTGSIIIYSTAPGKVAQDGNDRNSPFTKNLVEKMKIPGLKIEDVIKEVRKKVASETGGNQIPWESSSLMGDFYFVPASQSGTTNNYNNTKVVPKKENEKPFKPVVAPHEDFSGSSGVFTDVRDGQTYKWIRIDGKIWMAENLNVGKMITSDIEQTNNGEIEKYCYDDDKSYCKKYGGLYKWSEAMNHKTKHYESDICPPGWRLPSDADFLELINYQGGKYTGISLKEESGHQYKKAKYNVYEKNASGFSALLGGLYYYNGEFREQGKSVLFWTSKSEKMGRSKRKGNGAFRMKLHLESPDASVYTSDKKCALSIRCIKK